MSRQVSELEGLLQQLVDEHQKLLYNAGHYVDLSAAHAEIHAADRTAG